MTDERIAARLGRIERETDASHGGCQPTLPIPVHKAKPIPMHEPISFEDWRAGVEECRRTSEEAAPARRGGWKAARTTGGCVRPSAGSALLRAEDLRGE